MHGGGASGGASASGGVAGRPGGATRSGRRAVEKKSYVVPDSDEDVSGEGDAAEQGVSSHGGRRDSEDAGKATTSDEKQSSGDDDKGGSEEGDGESEYEKMKRRNVERNKKIMALLGIDNVAKEAQRQAIPKKKKTPSTNTPPQKCDRPLFPPLVLIAKLDRC